MNTKTRSASTALMTLAALNPHELAKLSGDERRLAHAQLLAMLAQVAEGDDRAAYAHQARQAWAAIGSAAA